MRVIVLDTEADARRLIRAIDAIRGATETLTVIDRGRVVGTRSAPAKTWAEPVPLRDGRWAVPCSLRRWAAFAGRQRTIDGVVTRVPSALSSELVGPAAIDEERYAEALRLRG